MKRVPDKPRRLPARKINFLDLNVPVLKNTDAKEEEKGARDAKTKYFFYDSFRVHYS
jgi:hypothetical protein